MKRGLYLRLAVIGIHKNKRLYIPYMLTCASMVMMHYIIVFLQYSDVLSLLSGADMIRSILAFGGRIIEIFSIIFLFYTNSFLMKCRQKEFGLYNILGMGKGNISRVLFWESIIEVGAALTAGLLLGITFSKLSELLLINILRGEVGYAFVISPRALVLSIVMFSSIFILIFLNSLRQLYSSNAIALLNSERAGEKPLKVNWLFAFAGGILLAAAYYIAVLIKDPLTAMAWFFIAVIMVIVATYLLFISGSVALCRILQKKKNYYYKAKNFVSVSSMAFRMKRNGAGLASICILVTMVLVMISGSACLYFGIEEIMDTRYPHDISIDIDLNTLEDIGDGNIEFLRSNMEQILAENSAEIINLSDYRYATITGLLTDGVLEADVSALTSFDITTYDNVCQIYFVPLDDYNRMVGTSYALSADEVMIYTHMTDYDYDTLTINNGAVFRIADVLEDFFGKRTIMLDILPSIFVIIPDIQSGINELMGYADFKGDRMVRLHWYYGFDMEAEAETEINISGQLSNKIRELDIAEAGGIYAYSSESLEADRDSFYTTDGGVFFLGIILSIVFIVATVLIIYYKQISEGYEDQARFDIMQKVGMTKQDIRRSVNSQMLIVFFAPLIVAVIHLAFAFPLIYKLLMLFGLTNLRLLLITTGISILVFALFYAVVYRITSNIYYNIVSGIRG